MWKNSSAVRALPSRNWTSSISSTSASAVALLEGLDAGALQRGDELVGEGLGGRVVDGELRGVAVEVVRDRAEQVGLAEPRGAVQEERVVGLAGRLGDRQRGGVGELVAGADHEALEGVVGVERDL